MRKAVTIRYNVLGTGSCRAREADLIRGGNPRQTVECHALIALLRHPSAGWTLWDTGYAPRIAQAAARFPYSLYLAATPIILPPGFEAVAQLAALGLTAKDISYVIVSHFHADHVAGLRDFPVARFVCARDAWEDVRARRGVPALRRAFLPDLIPADFAERTGFLDDVFTGEPLPHLGATHDLFGDGSLRLVRLPGHARGQLGLYAQTETGSTLFLADAAYSRRAIRECIPPHPRTNLFTEGGAKVAATLQALHNFARERPDVVLVPSHCPEAYAQLVVGARVGVAA